jgi:hypothetical protein
MKLDVNSFLKHANHEMVIDQRPVAHNIASLRCKKCNKHIKWLSRDELNSIQSLMATTNHGTPQGVKTRPVRESTARRSR